MTRYRRTRHLGEGGMGTVWHAWRELADGSEDRVAIKTLSRDAAYHLEARRRFALEAAQCLRFNHRNVIKVLDFVREHDEPMLVMEYVDGLSLAELRTWVEVRPEAIRTLLIGLLEGLDYVHEWGIVHRDIAPKNILISRAGDVRLADFGLMKFLEGPETEPGFKGTAAYASPEAIRGDTLDQSADLFSVGAVLYELVMGHPPHGEGSHVIIQRRQEERVIPPLSEHVPADLRAMVSALLHPDKTERCHNVTGVYDIWNEFDEPLLSPKELGGLVDDALRERTAARGKPVDVVEVGRAKNLTWEPGGADGLDELRSQENRRPGVGSTRRRGPSKWGRAKLVLACVGLGLLYTPPPDHDATRAPVVPHDTAPASVHAGPVHTAPAFVHAGPAPVHTAPAPRAPVRAQPDGTCVPDTPAKHPGVMRRRRVPATRRWFNGFRDPRQARPGKTTVEEHRARLPSQSI